MRPEHIEYHISQQLANKEFIIHAFDNLLNQGEPTRQRIEMRLQLLNEEWQKFETTHNAINLAFSKLTREEQNRLSQNVYFAEEVFADVRETYLEVAARMKTLQDDQPNINDNGTSSSHSSFHPDTQQDSNLPRINIPRFNGDLTEWIHFRDMFTSLVIERPKLSAVGKLQYLKWALHGSAARLIKNTPLSADNFQKSWDALVSFYENERLLVDATLQALFSLKKMSRESADEIEQLYTSLMQSYRTLETLNRPVIYWDDIFVYIATQRLDSESIREWENFLGPSKKSPTWEQLQTFLRTRWLALLAFERSHRGNKLIPQRRSHFSGHNRASTPYSCQLCSEHHSLSSCPEFQKKTTQQKREYVNENKLCFNCLGHHQVAKCMSTHRCRKCGKRHHTYLHPTVSSSVVKTTASSQTSKSPPDSAEKQVYHAQPELREISTVILLATAQVKVVNQFGESIQARVLLDQGSEVSLVTEKLVQHLRLPRQPTSVPLIGIGGHQTGNTRGITSLTLKPHFNSSAEITVKAHILPRLTSTIPKLKTTQKNWPHLQRLALADPKFAEPGSIDIIIGADMYGQLLKESIVKGSATSPTAQLTIFGWVISGPAECHSARSEIQTYHCAVDQDLQSLLERFWLQEEIHASKGKSLSSADQACEDHFVKTHSRDSTGRYIVRLPFKSSLNNLGDSRNSALKLLNLLQRKFDTDPKFLQAYSSFLNEYQQLHHMVKVENEEMEPPHTFYLPHHGVIRESSTTTKLRVVFNGSCRVVQGLPLNEILHTGAKIQTDLLDVLIWLRKFKYVFSSDVEKMYRQIQVHPDDWKFQRIFWKNDGKLIKYELTTVTYGLACAPFLAIRAILQLVQDEGTKFPLATESLTKGRYVDDVFGGADTIEEAQQKASQVYHLCMAGGFPLRKWSSNNLEVLNLIPTEHQAGTTTMKIKDSVVHALGLTWNPASDNLQFSLSYPTATVITKRTVLSRIAQFFDPLGLMSPVIIRAKIFMQELWVVKLNWDDPLPDSQLRTWEQIVQQMSDTSHFTIPRWIGSNSTSALEIHGFCDASQSAMAATVFIRTINEDKSIVTSLLCAKTKVAPLKRLTIPRLELTAAVLLTKLVLHVQRVLDLQQVPCYLWTDSSIVYTWINNHPAKWKDFIHNRVCFIQESLPQATWKHVPGTMNPADCATRGLTPSQLREHHLWWFGPPWLRQESQQWPDTQLTPITMKEDFEQRKSSPIVSLHASTHLVGANVLSHCSSLRISIRAMAIFKRAVRRMKKEPNTTLNYPLTPEELEEARNHLIKITQQEYFEKEFNQLKETKDLPRSSPMIRLLPFIDNNGLLRVRGRIRNSSLPLDAKQPYILPRNSPFTNLVIKDAHLQTLHGSTQDTLNYVRNTYWILGGRVPIKSFILKCVKCTRYRSQQAQTIMGQLPPSRVNPSRAFLHSGVDYAGPYNIKTWKGKNARLYKAWVAVFVCFSTSAIHLELVTDYSTDAFLAAYKRFTARRGICATLTSDCGTNFKGADKELQRLFSEASSQSKELANLLANDGTKWLFHPPGAPHFGGKWEAGVKSLKYHLKRVIGDSNLTYEEFTTLLTQVEAILNSRPLCPLTQDPDDLNVLTPAHFLVGQSLTLIPESNLETLKSSRLSRWQHLSQMTQSFWTKWSKEYLQRHQAVYKWNKTASPISKGDLVLIMDERYPPSKWALGRVIETHPGSDDIVRVVTIKTKDKTSKRPITKLCLLPLDSPSESFSLPTSTKAGGNV